MDEEGPSKGATPAVKFKDESFTCVHLNWYPSYVTAMVNFCLFSNVVRCSTY